MDISDVDTSSECDKWTTSVGPDFFIYNLIDSVKITSVYFLSDFRLRKQKK